MAAKADYDVADDTLRRFESILLTTPRGPTFGNARFARNVLEAAIGRQAWRLRDVAEPTVEQLRELHPDDLDDTSAQPVEAPTDTSAEPVQWPDARPFDELRLTRPRSATTRSRDESVGPGHGPASGAGLRATTGHRPRPGAAARADAPARRRAGCGCSPSASWSPACCSA